MSTLDRCQKVQLGTSLLLLFRLLSRLSFRYVTYSYGIDYSRIPSKAPLFIIPL